MSWFESLLPSKIRTSGISDKKNVPEGLWAKCDNCDAIIYRAELERNQEVCTKCDHHMRIGARRRLEQFLDEEDRLEIADSIESMDILRFRDDKKYKDRLNQAQKQTGEKDSLIVMQGKVMGVKLVVAAFEFKFMAGDGGEAGFDDTVTEEQSNLSLLAPGEGDSDAAGTQGDGEENIELSRQLAFAEEELDAARIENADLESRIAELEATLSKVQELQKMVEIEDDSLAQLQADQAAETAALEAETIEPETDDQTTVTEDATAATDTMIEDTSDTLTEDTSDTLTDETTDALTEETTDTLTEEMKTVDEEALLEDLLAEAPAIEVVEEETSEAPPAPVIVVEPTQDSGSMLDGIIPADITDLIPSMDILQDPLVLGGLGGILLLVIGLLFYRRWKSSREFVDMGISDADDENTGADGTLIEDEDLTPIQIVGEEDSVTEVVAPDMAGEDMLEEPAEVRVFVNPWDALHED